jgi:hypothetical protein
MFCSFIVVIVVSLIFIFVCTSVGLLPPGESPIAVSNNTISLGATAYVSLGLLCYSPPLVPQQQVLEL